MNATFVGDWECEDLRVDKSNTKVGITVGFITRVYFNIECDLNKIESWDFVDTELHIVLKDGTEKKCQGELDMDLVDINCITITDGNDNEDYETITV